MILVFYSFFVLFSASMVSDYGNGRCAMEWEKLLPPFFPSSLLRRKKNLERSVKIAQVPCSQLLNEDCASGDFVV